jgi:hypothetical protein
MYFLCSFKENNTSDSYDKRHEVAGEWPSALISNLKLKEHGICVLKGKIKRISDSNCKKHSNYFSKKNKISDTN